MALTAAGRIYVWGYNSHGQLGTTSCASQASQLPYGCSVPVLLPLTDVVAIAAGELHSLALTSSGVLYAWGRFAPDILSRVS